MRAEEGSGDMLKSTVATLVNPVNTHGVMGAGLAQRFRVAFPDESAAYITDARAGRIVVGRVMVYPTWRDKGPESIIAFPTKKHWAQPSRLEYIREGLVSLAEAIDRIGIPSIAVPALGCGLGGLDWGVVRPMIEEALAPTCARVFL